MLTHLIKFPQCPQIKFKADGSPEGPFRPSTCLWHPPRLLWDNSLTIASLFGSLDSPSLEPDYPLALKLPPHLPWPTRYYMP